MPWNHVLLVQVRYEVHKKWCQWWKYMYTYLLYEKSGWILEAAVSNFIDNKHFCTSPRLDPKSFKRNFNGFKKNLTGKKIFKWGPSRFRGSGGDDHQLYFFWGLMLAVLHVVRLSRGVAWQGSKVGTNLQWPWFFFLFISIRFLLAALWLNQIQPTTGSAKAFL